MREIKPGKAFTKFAPAERQSQDAVRASFFDISSKTLLPRILDAIPNICLIINKERQIVFANKALLEFLGVEDRLAVCGLRPGEILNCIHADETEHGCGTTEFCSTCGAVNAILASNNGAQDVRECRILSRDKGAVMDFRVWAAPVEIEGQSYCVFTINDISHEKRRRVLERVFFHDILNTAGAIRGFSELLQLKRTEDVEKVKERIHTLSKRLIEEIDGHKQLTAAESGELSVNPAQTVSTGILQDAVLQYGEHGDAKGRLILIDPQSEAVRFTTDPTLLRRVIGNLLKNALEASQEGEVVTLGCRRTADGVEFRVHNPACMPREAQLQVFHRSFSTKGPGRGLGTYSVRLLTRRYLNGEVTFTSFPESGTTFIAKYPLNLEEKAAFQPE
ncbi:MAG: Virulence sensor protein BvgS precursor [Syntrophorhabdaceae bacterium PtaU1.Bin034]|nr:MAG: Virulence sensor protein BvgS precursor [Syntrophorhabdaceae bacterium PtaU1.Bin034]